MNELTDHQIEITPLKHSTKEVSLVWRNLSYSISQTSRCFFNPIQKVKDNEHVIVQNQCGRVKSGELVAVIGPSGAGKTTLLECLAGRRQRGMSGSVYVTGSSDNETTLALLGQHDFLLGRLTVRETLTFAARFKSPSSDVNELVNSVLKQLNMTSCASHLAIKCSGGERKRLSIGIELIAKPQILILDESTSGLDSQSALYCIKFLEHLTIENDLAIIASIHQPSASLLSIFHKLLILSNDGHLLYFDTVKKLHPHLESLGFTCPLLHNIADYAVELASGIHGEDSIKKITEFAQSSTGEFSTSVDEESVKVTKMIERMQQATRAAFLHHTSVLILRTFVVTLREPWLNFLRFFAHILLAIVVSYLYSGDVGQADGCVHTLNQIANREFNQNFVAFIDVIQHEEGRVIDNISHHFFSLMFLMFTSLMVTVMVFPLEVTVFVKEHKNGCYSIASYYLAKTIADAPFTLFNTVIYTIITYYWTGQVHETSRFVLTMFCFVLISFIGQSIGMLVGAIWALKPDQAVFVAPISQLPFVLLSGFFIKIPSMPGIIQIVSYTAYMRYAFQLVVQMVYGLNRCSAHNILNETVNECAVFGRLQKIVQGADIDISTIMTYLSMNTYDKAEYANTLPELEKDLMTLNARYANATLNYTMTATQLNMTFYQDSFVMNLFSVTDDTLYTNMTALILFIFVIRLAAYFALSNKASQRK